MIFFYGTRSSHVKSEPLDYAVCPSCETEGELIMSTYSRYAHVFWIPLFPMSKKVYASCNHCKTTLELPDMTPDLKSQCIKFRKAQKFPVWQFFGVAAICILIIFAIIEGNQNSRKQNFYLMNPQVNDVYVVKYEEDSFSTMKIVEIKGDSIFFADNEYAADNGSKVETIDEDENYNYEELLGFTANDLKDLKKDKIILLIKRK